MSGAIASSSLLIVWAEDGYGLFYSVGAILLWIVVHGVVSEEHRQQKAKKTSIYLTEFILKLIISIGYWSIFMWLVRMNPPFWNPEITAQDVTINWLELAIAKQFIEYFIYVGIIDFFLQRKSIIAFFNIKPNTKESDRILVVMFILGVSITLIDALLMTFMDGGNGYDFFQNLVFEVPLKTYLIRAIVLVTLLASGVVIKELFKKNLEKEKTISTEHQRLKVLLDSAEDIVFQKDLNNRFVYISSNGLNAFELK